MQSTETKRVNHHKMIFIPSEKRELIKLVNTRIEFDADANDSQVDTYMIRDDLALYCHYGPKIEANAHLKELGVNYPGSCLIEGCTPEGEYFDLTEDDIEQLPEIIANDIKKRKQFLQMMQGTGHRIIF